MPQTPKSDSGLDPDERESLVCNLFCQGKSVQEILQALAGRVELTREQPYAIVRHAARLGRIKYTPPLASDLALRLMEEYHLKKVRIVQTTEPADVAAQAATLLVETVRNWTQPDLHIGFAGGAILQETVRLMAEALRRPGAKMATQRIYFHALTAASHDPLHSPNAFLHWFMNPGFPFQTHFIGLPAPGIVSTRTLRALRRLEGIREAYDCAGDIDIVVSSAGAHWSNGCSALHELYTAKAEPAIMDELTRAGVVGDVLWQPFSATSGPVNLETGIRAVTLLDLDELPALIERGKQVVLVLAPCGKCHGPKTDILRAVLNCNRPFVTHLVADARAAAGVFS